MNHSRRDLAMLLPVLAAAKVSAQTEKKIPSTVYRYEDLPVKANAATRQRQTFNGQTHSGFHVDLHLTELAPGQMPHAAHHHVHEEIVMVQRGTLEVTIKDIKKLEPIEIDDEFLQSLGFQKEQELRDALRDQMVERIDFDIKQAMRRQVIEQLISQVDVKLPSKLSDRQTDRVVNRRAVDLLMKGIPRERIEQNVEQLRSGAQDEAVRELKTFFMMQKVAQELKVDVSEGELNNRIATLAYQQGRRPERLKQEMAKDGNTLSNLYVSMREEKAIDKIIETAEVEEVAATPEQAKTGRAEPDKESEST